MDKESMRKNNHGEASGDWRFDVLSKIKYDILKSEMGLPICKKCGSRKNVGIHHIKSRKDYPELKYDKDNCIWLCYKCHKKVHQEKGEDLENERDD